MALLLLFNWLGVGPSAPVVKRVADPANQQKSSPAVEKVNFQGTLQKFDGIPSALTGAWPWFRGPDFNNISAENVKLRTDWGEAGPPVLWSVNLGEGYAGPAVRNGCVYLLDYDEAGKRDSLRCFSLETGEEIWRRSYRVIVQRNHGMSRTVPAVTERAVITVGPKCHVVCVDARNGNFKWGIDLVRDFGTTVPLWYTGQCPLIDGAQVILAPGGKCLLMGVDLETGRVLWETPNPEGFQMSHSSVVRMVLGSRKMYVYCAIGAMVGVAADGPDRGRILWQTKEWNLEVISPSPVQLPENRILVTAGYGAGSMLFQIKESGDGFTVKPLWKLGKETFGCEQQTPLYYQGHLFSVLPNDAGALKRQLVCLNVNGEIVWSSGKEHRFGFGPFMIGDGKLLILDDEGVLTIIEASITGYVELAQAKVLPGVESWAPMALVGGRLLLRDSTQMRCLDLREP
ncbi:MAG TPA: PQQ-binding-like beta-propeller repeat protein [Bacillota bacterium]|nr:PQQ-binding-like beta-propeller repeat protein [Bacillota bacterium]